MLSSCKSQNISVILYFFYKISLLNVFRITQSYILTACCCDSMVLLSLFKLKTKGVFLMKKQRGKQVTGVNEEVLQTNLRIEYKRDIVTR